MKPLEVSGAVRPLWVVRRQRVNFQPAATPEPDGLCGNQRYRRALLMMDITVPETC